MFHKHLKLNSALNKLRLNYVGLLWSCISLLCGKGRSKNGTPTRHMFQRDWTTCLKFILNAIVITIVGGGGGLR